MGGGCWQGVRVGPQQVLEAMAAATPHTPTTHTHAHTSSLAQVVAVCIVGIVWRTHAWAHWMILGLALDNFGRVVFGAGPSPLAQLARCGAALMKPSFRPGVPKQFAAACGTFMAVVATVLMFTEGGCAGWRVGGCDSLSSPRGACMAGCPPARQLPGHS